MSESDKYDDMKVKCDRCGARMNSLYQYSPGQWRCLACIWHERQELVTICERIKLDLIDWADPDGEFEVSRRDLLLYVDSNLGVSHAKFF